MRDISKQLRQVWDFQKAFLHPQTDSLDMGKEKGRELRYNLLDEELKELFQAFNEHNYVEVLDALVDLLYINFGTVHYHGFRQFSSFVQHSLSSELDYPTDYPVQIDNLLNVVKHDYIDGTITASNTLSWNVNLCIYVLSCFNDLTDAGIFKEGSFELAFTEVHQSNMSKLDQHGKPIFRKDGKVMKSELYQKPELKKFINPKYL